MESERTGQDVHVEPLQAEPDPDPDVRDPTTKGTTYPTYLDEPDEAGPAGDITHDTP